MGEHELQEALRVRTQEQIRLVWQTAEAAVTTRRAEVGEHQRAVLESMAQELATAAAGERRKVLAAAERKLRQQRLATVATLESRLHALAVQLLPGLGMAEDRRLWQALAGELPAAAWQHVRVHPEDLGQARQAFPAAVVEGDATLAGGLVATTADGRIVLDNSLAGRLQLAWSELLTPLLAAVCAEGDQGVAGPAPTG
jgi:vacuolar-type H+-ATPase subunit E/Vma4